MRPKLLPLLLLVFVLLLPGRSSSQVPTCSASVPFFLVDLRGNPAGTWVSPTHSRNSNCCGTTSPDRCTSFEILLDTGAAMINFEIASGAIPPGSMFYQISCGSPTPVGQPICIVGPGPHYLTFCKPGNNTNEYRVTSIPKPLFPKDDTARIGCSLPIHVLGLVESSVTWNSVFPGAPGAYNSYLSCVSNCDTVLYTPAVSAPPFVDYVICGTPIATACGYVAVCDTVRIYNYSALSASVSPNPGTFCAGGPGVVLTGTAGGGQSPYTYTWRDQSLVIVGSSAAYTATNGGTYSLEVRDQLYDPIYCPSTFVSVPAIAVPPPTVNAGPDDTLCPGSPVAILNGSVQNATGGTWSGGAGTFNPSNTSLVTAYTPTAAEIAAGQVTLTLTSTGAGGGCTNASDAVTLHFPSPIVVTVNDASVGCHGSTTTLNSSVTGGLAPYSYQWSNGAVTNSITVGAGTWCLTITDNLGCVANDCGTITQPAALNVTTSSTPCSTNGGNNGTATATVSGGTAPYTYLWSNSATTATISGLSYGIYTVIITDANGCQVVSSVVVNEPRCNSYQVSASATNVGCYNGATGSATATVIVGNPGYTYHWNDPLLQTTATASNLAAGVYQCLVTDASNCSAVVSATITQPAQLTNTMTHTNVTTIGGNNGSATANISGGAPAYTYAWSNGGTSASISSLTAGTYTVVVHDQNNCVLTDSVPITQPPCNNLTLSVVTSPALCNGSSNGSATAIVLLANNPVSYHWSTGATTSSISGLAAGSYSVSITDAANCTTFSNFTITAPSALSLGLSPTNIRCNESNDGTVEMTVNGGTYPYTYTWSNGLATEDLINLSNGTYSVLVTDAHGCTATATTMITRPAPIVITSVVTSITCHGGNNGAIDASVSGGTSPYTYSWSNGSTTQDLSSLVAGSYILTVTDANNCTNVTPFSEAVNEPDVVHIDSMMQYCPVPGSGVAQVDVYPGGGNPGNYSISFDNGNTYLAAGVYTTFLSAGNTYQVVMHDNSGCSVVAPTSLVIPPVVDIQTVSFNPCVADGITSIPVTLTTTGGNGGPLSASFDNGTTYLAAGTMTTNLATGNSYTIVVKDSSGCLSTTESISIPNEIVLSGTTSSFNGGYQVSCNGNTDGSINLSITGGNGTYSYAWSNSSTTQDLASIGAGTYSVVVTDGNSCADTINFTLTEPALLTSSAVSSSNYHGFDISCNGSTDGSVNLTVNGGTTGYAYAWSNAATSEDLSLLGAGTYSVTVTDANGCVTTSTVTLTQPAALVATTIQQDVLCNTYATGSVNLTMNGGAGSNSFAWSNSATTEDLSGLTAGSYSVTITDINGCTTTSSVTITEPTHIALTGTTADLTCFANNTGSIDLQPSGGTPAYSYAWSNAATTEDLTGLAAGTYSVIVTDLNACADTITFTLTEPALLTSAATATTDFNGYEISCNGNTDGAIDLVVNGGTVSYSYSWSNGGITEDLSGLAAGTYSVTVTDANGCVTTSTVTLTQPAALVATTTQQDVLCNTYATGSVNLTMNGGAGSNSFAWSNSATTEDLSGLTAGSYSVTITDINGCTTTSSVTITEPTHIALTGTTADLTCFANNTGSIDLQPSGGTPAYSYAWSNAATTEDLTGLAAGTYSVIVTDLNACADTITFTLTEPTLLTSAATATTDFNGYEISCNGGSNGAIDLVVNGGTTGYTYSWSNSASTEDLSAIPAGTYSVLVTDANGCTTTATVVLTEPALLDVNASHTDVPCNGFFTGAIDITMNGGVTPYGYLWSTSAVTEDLSGIGAGTYSVTITDANGCSIDTTIDITESSPVVLDHTMSNPNCYGGSDGSADLQVSGGTSPFTYSWSNGQTQQDPVNLAAGTYYVTVTDANNCTSLDTVWILDPPLLVANLTSPLLSNGHNVSYYGGDDGSIDLSVNGGTQPYNYQWNNGSLSQDLTGVGAGTYTVLITDANGCTTTGSINLDEPLELQMPTGYSPNGDGQNDFFVIHGIEAYPKNNLEVYNRWGNLVYAADNYQNTWNGYNDSGDKLPDGTYFVILNINNGEITLTGYVDVRR